MAAKSDKKIRYAVVGVGWIAQEVILPAFKNTDNSELVALVTDDPEKARELSDKYDVAQTHSSGEYDALLSSGSIDAVYIALPNNMHADYTIRAARAGVHVLCEKPMAANSQECEAMIEAAKTGGIKLMIAYRLHFDPANLRAIEIIQAGELGELRAFGSLFGQQVEAGNIRLRRDLAGGPLMDMGIYQINATRYLFRDEPEEAMAIGVRGNDPRFSEVHESVSVVLKFPGDRLASFTNSFGIAPIDEWSVVGTKGSMRLKPGFEYQDTMRLQTTIDEKENEEKFSKHDQFGAEIQYFSACVLENREPEPGGREGLADIRIIEALMESMHSGKPVKLPPYHLDQRPTPEQKIKLSPVKAKEFVNVESPSGKK